MHYKRYNKASSKIAKRRQARESLALFFKMLLPFIFLVGLIWFLRTSFLQVKDFQFAGNETLSAESLKTFVQNQTSGHKFLFIPKTNILFLNKNEIASALLSNFPRLASVEANKNLFGRNLVFTLVERRADLIWCAEGDRCFNMTNDGLIFEPTTEISNQIIFRGGVGGDPLLENFAPTEVMGNYLKLIAEFERAGFEISEIRFETSDRVIAKSSINGAMSDIVFNPNDLDFSLLIQNTILLINETLNKNPKAAFEYIDARFGNKFFYKLRS